MKKKTIRDAHLISKELDKKRKSSMFASKVDRFRAGGEDLLSGDSSRGDSKEWVEIGVVRNNAQKTMLLLNEYRGDGVDTSRIFKK